MINDRETGEMRYPGGYPRTTATNAQDDDEANPVTSDDDAPATSAANDASGTTSGTRGDVATE